MIDLQQRAQGFIRSVNLRIITHPNKKLQSAALSFGGAAVLSIVFGLFMRFLVRDQNIVLVLVIALQASFTGLLLFLTTKFQALVIWMVWIYTLFLFALLLFLIGIAIWLFL